VELNERLQALESSVQEHINLTKKYLDEAQKRKEQLSEEPEEEEDDGAQRKLATQEIEEQSRLLEADQTFSNAVSSQLRSKLSGRESGNTYTATLSGSNNQGLQVGNNPGTVNWNSK
jgi:hypothetical protein